MEACENQQFAYETTARAGLERGFSQEDGKDWRKISNSFAYTEPSKVMDNNYKDQFSGRKESHSQSTWRQWFEREK